MSRFFVGIVLLLSAIQMPLAEEKRKILTGLAAHANKQTIRIKSGETFSLQELHWIQPGKAWEQVLEEKVSLENENFPPLYRVSNRYGDKIGQIYTSSFGWLQEYWIRKGAAVWSGRGPYPPALRQTLLAAEQKARVNREGGWQHFKVYAAENVADLEGRNGFQIVEGVVQAVRKTGSGTYLNFGLDWKTDFTASVSSRNRARFKKLDWKLSALENKWIRVRGIVRSYNGPFMEIVFPEQIEILEEGP
ncbi:MAG: OB-fold nucleic acid binding domain-containing protein [Sneathiella sp.]